MKKLLTTLCVMSWVAYIINANAQGIIGDTITSFSSGLGYDLELSGDGLYLAVSTPYGDNVNGELQVYKSTPSGWDPRGVAIQGTFGDESLGDRIDISSDASRVVSSSSYYDGFSGYVVAHQWDGSEYVQIGNFIYGHDYAGAVSDVRISGDGQRIVFGSFFATTSVVEWNETTMAWDSIYTAPSSASGRSVAINDDGTTIAATNFSSTG